jgi:hypothetical protein
MRFGPHLDNTMRYRCNADDCPVEFFGPNTDDDPDCCPNCYGQGDAVKSYTPPSWPTTEEVRSKLNVTGPQPRRCDPS